MQTSMGDENQQKRIRGIVQAREMIMEPDENSVSVQFVRYQDELSALSQTWGKLKFRKL